MPTISSSYGIAIRMYVQDHPPPHWLRREMIAAGELQASIAAE